MPTTKDEDVLPYFRPVIREDFNAEFLHAAGTPGAPERPHDVVGKVTLKTKNVLREIAMDAQGCYLKSGHMMVTSLAVTNPGLLDCLDSLSATLVLQKFSPSKPLTERYAKFFSLYPRSAFPGNILTHLVRRDGQQDFGMMDGVRLVGNYYANNVMRVNEKRPLLHPKIIVFLKPNKSTGLLVPYISWDGSANATENGEFSFEEMNRSEDPAFVMAKYLTICHYYSLSEGLFNFSGGVVPTYRWDEKAKKHSTPKCPSCKSNKLVVRWLRTEDHPREHRKYLACTDCDERIPYLNEHVPCL